MVKHGCIPVSQYNLVHSINPSILLRNTSTPLEAQWACRRHYGFMPTAAVQNCMCISHVLPGYVQNLIQYTVLERYPQLRSLSYNLKLFSAPLLSRILGNLF